MILFLLSISSNGTLLKGMQRLINEKQRKYTVIRLRRRHWQRVNYMKRNDIISKASRTGARIAFILPIMILFAGLANAASAANTASTSGRSQLGTPTLSINGTSFGNGNTITLNAYVSGGRGPYTYNFTIENAATKEILESSGPMLNSNTFRISASPMLNGNDIALVQVSDSATPQAVSVSAPTAFAVNSTMQIISNPAVSNSTPSQGASQTAPPASTTAFGAGIIVIIALAVFGAYLYSRSSKR